MIFDTYGCIRMEHCAFPGNIGDSCAETSRAVALETFLRGPFEHRASLLPFFTQYGIVRHPDSPWRENDTSSDQVLPLLVACHMNELNIDKTKIMAQRTGNGDLVSPLLYACQQRYQKDSSWFWDLSVLGQAILSKVPIRWSDEKKRIEVDRNSSCDFLNLIMCMIHASYNKTETWPLKLTRKILSKNTLLSKVEAYYACEPSAFVVLLYRDALDKLYK